MLATSALHLSSHRRRQIVRRIYRRQITNGIVKMNRDRQTRRGSEKGRNIKGED
jgi:hypothetical protein